MWLYAPAVAATFANASIGETPGRKRSVIAEANERKTYERVGKLVPVVGVVKLNDSVLFDEVCGCKTSTATCIDTEQRFILQSTRASVVEPHRSCGEDSGYVLRQHHSLG